MIFLIALLMSYCVDLEGKSDQKNHFTNFTDGCWSGEEISIIRKLMRNYSKHGIPYQHGVDVSVEVTLNAVTGLSEIRSEFELDIFFSEIWTDPRLSYEHLDVCSRNITLDVSYLRKIWQPNICVVNSKSSLIHMSPSRNIFLILYQNGRVWRNCRMKLTAPCVIDLKIFPFDRQPCSLVFESYSYNVQKVRLSWYDPTPVSIPGRIHLPDFFLHNFQTYYNRVNYPNGRWDQLNVTFYFQRKYGFFVLQLYVPTYMTIFVAWISFWFDPKELATRATLTISAFLAMTLQFGNILVNMPPVSYIKAIDLWMLGGIGFLFLALAELAVISYVMRSDRPYKSRRTRSCKKRFCVQNGYCSSKATERLASSSCYSPAPVLGKAYERRLFGRWTPYQIDRFCLIAFTPLFVIFNFSYWSVCTFLA